MKNHPKISTGSVDFNPWKKKYNKSSGMPRWNKSSKIIFCKIKCLLKKKKIFFFMCGSCKMEKTY
jgi:hypothetical protein